MPQGTPASSQIITLTRMLEEREETMYAQAAVIEKLREALIAGWSLQCDFDDARKLADDALAIPTDSTQILAEVRRAERERVYQVADNAYATEHVLLAIRAME